MNTNITSPDYRPEAMTAAESARFHACACDPARRRHNPAPDQGVMFGQLGLLDVIAESTADSPVARVTTGDGRPIMRLGPVARQVIDIPELRGALDELTPAENPRCTLCAREYSADEVVPSGLCPECDARYPTGLRITPVFAAALR